MNLFVPYFLHLYTGILRVLSSWGCPDDNDPQLYSPENSAWLRVSTIGVCSLLASYYSLFSLLPVVLTTITKSHLCLV